MKGHMEDGKFHPHTQSNGVRKSRDQEAKTEGVKIRKQRSVNVPSLKDAEIHQHNYDFVSKNGKVEELMLGNHSDAGFFWNGKQDSLIHFLVMMSGYKHPNEFLDGMEKEGVTLDMLRPLMLKNISGKLVDDETDDGLYALSGGDSVWKFGDIPELDLKNEYLDDWDYKGRKFTPEENVLIENEFYFHYKGFGYEDFLKEFGEEARNELKKQINEANDLGDLFGEWRSDDEFQDKFEKYDQLTYPKVYDALGEAVEALIKKGELSNG